MAEKYQLPKPDSAKNSFLVRTCGDLDLQVRHGGLEVTFLTCTTADVDTAQVWDSSLKWRHHGENSMRPSGRTEDGGFINCLGVLVIGREVAIIILSFYEK